MLKAVIFDMDGTLVDNMRFHDEAWFELLSAQGASFNRDTFFSQTAGMKNPPILRIFLGDDLSDEDCERLSQEKESHYRRLYKPNLAPIGGLEQLFADAAEAGIALGVATSAPVENIDFVMDGLEIRHKFGAIVGAADIKNGKPAPDIYLKAAELLGAKPEECLVVEDAPLGVESAFRAGCPCLVLTTSLTYPESMALPGVVAAATDLAAFPLSEMQKLFS
jgi:beta-phosphoglucomutase family hydrolase